MWARGDSRRLTRLTTPYQIDLLTATCSRWDREARGDDCGCIAVARGSGNGDFTAWAFAPCRRNDRPAWSGGDDRVVTTRSMIGARRDVTRTGYTYHVADSRPGGASGHVRSDHFAVRFSRPCVDDDAIGPIRASAISCAMTLTSVVTVRPWCRCGSTFFSTSCIETST
jgi:hypothetical protein